MESTLTAPRRPSSHLRENHSLGPDRPFLVKRHRDASREQAHVLSDDDDMPTTSRGEKHRRKKKHASSFAAPPIPGFRSGLSSDTFAERSQRPSRQKHGTSRPFTDAPPSTTRPMPRGRRDVSHDGKVSSAKTPSIIAASDDETGPQPNYSGPIASMEFTRLKRELEVLKKVCSLHSRCAMQLIEPA